jgi:hypothetical protein
MSLRIDLSTASAGDRGRTTGAVRALRSRGVQLLGVTAAVLLAWASVAATRAHAEECPNAAYRTGPSAHLPDCRAYELVTPPFENAAQIQANSLSPEGSPISVDIGAATEGLEALPNLSLGTGATAIYSITRTASGWKTVPDEPPTSEYKGAARDISDYAGESLGGQEIVNTERKLGQPENSVGFFMHRPDGSTVEIGPALPPSAPPGPATQLLREAVDVEGMSADGSRYLFSLKNFLWPGDGSRAGLGSLYEYLGVENKTPLLVAVGDNGEQIGQCGTVLGGSSTLGGSQFTSNAVSADGNTLFFTAFPDNYEGHGCNLNAPPVAEVYARIDNGLPGAHTVSISEPSEEDCSACYSDKKLISAGQLANALFMGASEDGSKVFFETTQPLLGEDTSNNIYEYDFDAPPGERIVHVSGGDATVANPAAEVLQGGEESVRFLASQDGSHIYFLTTGVLTRTPNRQGETAEAGEPNLYLFERDAEYPAGHTAFIARLAQDDLGCGCTSGFQANVTPDGRFLVFTSNRDLTPDDTSTTRQVFEYDAQTGTLVRVSIGQAGYNHNGNSSANFATIQGAHDHSSYESSDYWSHLSVSADGAYVFFESSAALTPQALEGYTNVYEYHGGQLSLISDGQDTALTGGGQSVVKLVGTDASGDDVFFTTADRLVGQDVDTNVDIYDARIDGGFPAPAVPPSCEGEGCQGPLGAAPTLLSPGSEFQAGANPPLAAAEPTVAPKSKAAAKAKRCKDGATLKHGKCVKGKAKARKASTDRRGKR